MIAIDASGIWSHRAFPPAEPRLCVFEFVYFARPDSLLYGRDVHGVRRAMGHILADEAPAEADVVVPVPESGIPAAQGYSATSGIRYVDGLVKNRYIGRTFIDPAPSLRERGIRMKLNPIRSSLEGRRVVLVDDSIVRGTTTKKLVQMVRDAGATEVHLRISSPPYRWPCFYGMDTSDRDSLLAAHMEVDEIRDHLDVDSLAYLTVGGLMRATATEGDPFCTACLTGEYPTEIGEGKFVLEGSS
jgi:amidophosphoribosyltransferase